VAGYDAGEANAAERFFAALTDGAAPISASHIAVVIAHPDDETIGCGAMLARLSGVKIVMLTDGAPKNLRYARERGFDTAQDYAEARRRELAAALSLAGLPMDAVVPLDIPDQQAAEKLPDIALGLAGLFASWQTRIGVTHAYEGGHFDHDAAAFAVHAAKEICSARGQHIDIVEMPFYRAGVDGEVKQSFPSGERHIAVRLQPGEVALKREMVACHATQASVLKDFVTDVERFRTAPPYDFSEPANNGRLLYEWHDWGMSAARWCELVAAARARL
jgi:N-acetylglucosamine malate deacetylase 2